MMSNFVITGVEHTFFLLSYCGLLEAHNDKRVTRMFKILFSPQWSIAWNLLLSSSTWFTFSVIATSDCLFPQLLSTNVGS